MSEFEIKERLAQNIFLEMMKESGFNIKKLDYEGVLQELIDREKNLDLADAIKDVNLHKHDFLVEIHDKLLFLQVVFDKAEREFDEGLENAVIVVVKNSEPFFEIAFVDDFVENGILNPLTNNEILMVDEAIVEKYKDILQLKLV